MEGSGRVVVVVVVVVVAAARAPGEEMVAVEGHDACACACAWPVVDSAGHWPTPTARGWPTGFRSSILILSDISYFERWRTGRVSASVAVDGSILQRKGHGLLKYKEESSSAVERGGMDDVLCDAG
jgi:hypothetical protein